MTEKTSIRLTGIEEEWEELTKHISGSRSDFLRKCIVEKVQCKDEHTELLKKLKEKKIEMEMLQEEVENLEKRLSTLQKQQSLNAKNELLISELLETCRTVAYNEGLTEKRVMAIANDKINYRLLINRLEEEGIKIVDGNENNTRLVETKNGDTATVKPYVAHREKSSFETLLSIFKRDYNHNGFNKSPIKFLDENKERYETMCSKYDNMSYASFKKKLKEYYS